MGQSTTSPSISIGWTLAVFVLMTVMGNSASQRVLFPSFAGYMPTLSPRRALPTKVTEGRFSCHPGCKLFE